MIAIAAAYFTVILNFSFWRYILTHIEIEDFQTLLFVCSMPFLLFILLAAIFNIILLPYITKPLLGLLLIISSTANYMMYKYSIYIDSDMIRNVFETNSREAFDLITLGLLAWVLMLGILPAIALFFIKIEYKPFFKELQRGTFVLLVCFSTTAVLAFAFYKDYASFGRNNREVRKLINPANHIYALVRYFQIEALAKRQFMRLDENAKLVPFEDPYPTVFVLVLGETARALNFSLGGYEKETNPQLSKQDMAYFKEVFSCGTATAVSVPCMFSHMSASKFNNNDAAFTENVMDLLKQSGYNIIWLENDDGCKGVCNRVYTENMVKTNNPKYCNGEYCIDEALIDGFEDRLKQITKNTVIVLHTMGSHGPTYYKRYPNKFKVFKPTCDTADLSKCSREAIINTYDNTILYTDFIISSVIDSLKKFPELESGLLYLSDHGESLGENNIYLHGFPYKIAPTEQKEVPMALWMSENMKKYDHVDYECIKNEAQNNKYSHDNLFHTMLGILEVKTEKYDPKLDVITPCRLRPLPQ